MDGEPRTYSIWVCVNGQREAEAEMARFGIALEAENHRRLLDCGFLVVARH